jgi:hypothetical protein
MQTAAHTVPFQLDSGRYAKCIDLSKRVRWDIERDVIRGRGFDLARKFLPDGMTKVDRIGWLDAPQRRLLSQIQGRTYANMFGLVERFINAKMLEVSRDHWLGDQTALEALVRFSEEELKHQALFRRLESLMADCMPIDYVFVPEPDPVAALVLGKSTWSVLALTCHIELFTQAHYRASIADDPDMSELYKDVFLFHWKEESQHAVIDELEWQREDAKLDASQREQAVDDLIALVIAIDGMLQGQAAADAHCFARQCGRVLSGSEATEVEACILGAYRWQYIVSGVQQPRFLGLLTGMVSDAQAQRISAALAPLMR